MHSGTYELFTDDKPFYVHIDSAGDNAPLAIIVHGSCDSHLSPAPAALQKAYKENNYTTVSIDVRGPKALDGETPDPNHPNKSDAEPHLMGFFMPHALFIEDTETTIKWLRETHGYEGPIALAGHSMGGAVLQVASGKNPLDINHVLIVAGHALNDLDGIEEVKSQVYLIKAGEDDPERNAQIDAAAERLNKTHALSLLIDVKGAAHNFERHQEDLQALVASLVEQFAHGPEYKMQNNTDIGNPPSPM